MISVHYINPLKQYGKIGFDLVIESSELGNHRILKKFSDDVTEQSLRDEACRALSRILEEINLPLPDEEKISLDCTSFSLQIDWPPNMEVVNG